MADTTFNPAAYGFTPDKQEQEEKKQAPAIIKPKGFTPPPSYPILKTSPTKQSEVRTAPKQTFDPAKLGFKPEQPIKLQAVTKTANALTPQPAPFNFNKIQPEQDITKDAYHRLIFQRNADRGSNVWQQQTGGAKLGQPEMPVPKELQNYRTDNVQAAIESFLPSDLPPDAKKRLMSQTWVKENIQASNASPIYKRAWEQAVDREREIMANPRAVIEGALFDALGTKAYLSETDRFVPSFLGEAKGEKPEIRKGFSELFTEGQRKRGAADIIGGGFKALTPVIAVEGFRNPVPVMKGLIAADIGSHTAEILTEKLGGDPDTIALAGTLGALIPGAIGGGYGYMKEFELKTIDSLARNHMANGATEEAAVGLAKQDYEKWQATGDPKYLGYEGVKKEGLGWLLSKTAQRAALFSKGAAAGAGVPSAGEEPALRPLRGLLPAATEESQARDYQRESASQAQKMQEAGYIKIPTGMTEIIGGDMKSKLTPAQAAYTASKLSPEDIAIHRASAGDEGEFAVIEAKTELGSLAFVVPDRIFGDAEKVAKQRQLGTQAMAIPQSVWETGAKEVGLNLVKYYLSGSEHPEFSGSLTTPTQYWMSQEQAAELYYRYKKLSRSLDRVNKDLTRPRSADMSLRQWESHPAYRMGQKISPAIQAAIQTKLAELEKLVPENLRTQAEKRIDQGLTGTLPDRTGITSQSAETPAPLARSFGETLEEYRNRVQELTPQQSRDVQIKAADTSAKVIDVAQDPDADKVVEARNEVSKTMKEIWAEADNLMSEMNTLKDMYPVGGDRLMEVSKQYVTLVNKINKLEGVLDRLNSQDIGQVRQFNDGSTVVYLSRRAMDKFSRSFAPGKHISGARIGGDSETRGHILGVLERASEPGAGFELRKTKAEVSRYDKALYDFIKKAFERTGDDPAGTVFSSYPEQGISEATNTLREELLHAWQSRISTEGNTTKHLDEAEAARLAKDVPNKMQKYLQKYRYDLNDHNTVVVEAAAKFMAADSAYLKKLGVTPKEVSRWLFSYFYAIEQKYGAGAFDTLKYHHKIARDIRREYERIFNAGRPRTGQEPTGQAGREGGRAPSGRDVGGVPSQGPAGNYGVAGEAKSRGEVGSLRNPQKLKELTNKSTILVDGDGHVYAYSDYDPTGEQYTHSSLTNELAHEYEERTGQDFYDHDDTSLSAWGDAGASAYADMMGKGGIRAYTTGPEEAGINFNTTDPKTVSRVIQLIDHLGRDRINLDLYPDNLPNAEKDSGGWTKAVSFSGNRNQVVNGLKNWISEHESGYGSQNKTVSTEDYNTAVKALNEKLFRQHFGFDPSMMGDAIKIGTYHFEAGAHSFKDWSAKMVEELGDRVKPYLKKLWEHVRGESKIEFRNSDATIRRPQTRFDAPPGLPNPRLVRAIAKYNKQNGLPEPKRYGFLPVDSRYSAIADAYDKMVHNPNDPEVRAGYGAMIDGVKKQWHFAEKELGIKFEPWNTPGMPYEDTSSKGEFGKSMWQNMVDDIIKNKHLWFFRGGDLPDDHPLAAIDPETGYTYNEMFRGIHDVFGHATNGFDFSQRGEENAWAAHLQSFDPVAAGVLTTETKGQNSWVNARNAGKPYDQWVFPDQKAAILPERLITRPETRANPTGQAYEFYSPNVYENLSLEDAMLRQKGFHQKWLNEFTNDLDVQLGLKGTHENVFGDWSTGAENSVFSRYRNIDLDTLRYVSALKGKYANQNAVAPFFVADQYGKDALYSFTVEPKRMDLSSKSQLEFINRVRDTLDRAEIKFRTLAPQSGGAIKVMVVDNQNGELADKLTRVVRDQLNVRKMEKITGRGDFVEKGDYDRIIEEYERLHPERRYDSGRNPELHRRRILPASGGPFIEIEHRSYVAGIDKLKGDYFGTGYGGEALERSKTYPDLFERHRTYATVPPRQFDPIPGQLAPEAYRGRVNRENYYDITNDPLNVLEMAQKRALEVYPKKGIYSDAIRTAAEQIVKQLGYDGFYDVRNDAIMSYVDIPVDAKDKIPATIAKYLTPEELKEVRKADSAQALLDTMHKLPPIEEWLAAAKAGEAGRQWYAHAADAFDMMREVSPNVFRGEDKQRWVDFLAALSPQQSVKLDLDMALEYWKRWVDNGRPLNRSKLNGLFSDLPLSTSRRPNAIRALLGEPLSGYKVTSFGKNMLREHGPVVNDLWMGVYTGVEPQTVSQPTNYFAINAMARQVAERLGWHPEEVQASIWAFTKALTEMTGKNMRYDPQDVLKLMTSDDISRRMADMSQLLRDSDIQDRLEALGVDTDALNKKLQEIDASEPSARPGLFGIEALDRDLLRPTAERIRTAKDKLSGDIARKLGEEFQLESTEFDPSELEKPKKPQRVISEERYQSAKKNLSASLFRMHAGIDPSAFGDMMTIGLYHFENGVRDFGQWSRKMLQELGQKVQPHLSEIWKRVNEKRATTSPPLPTSQKELARFQSAELAKSLYAPAERTGLKDSLRYFAEHTAGLHKDQGLTDKTAGIIRENRAHMARKIDNAEHDVWREEMRMERPVKDLPQSAREYQDQAKGIGIELSDTQAFQLDMIDRIEHGRPQARKEDQPIADMLRKLLDGGREEIRGLGDGFLESFYENYFPHIWKDPDAFDNFIRSLRGKRPLIGRASMLMERTIPTFKEGVMKGHQPISFNPVTLALAKYVEEQRFVAGWKIFQELKKDNLTVFRPAGSKPLPGWVRVDDRVFRVPFKGEYQVPEPVGKILNRFLSPSLSQAFPEWRRWVYNPTRSFNNLSNMMQVAISMFHPLLETSLSMATEGYLALDNLVHGKPIKAAGHLLKGATPLSAAFDYRRGWNIKSEWLQPGRHGGEVANFVDEMLAGGGRAFTDKAFYNAAMYKWWKAIKAHDYPGILGHSFGATMEVLSYPIMRDFVPKMKMGVFGKLAERELEKLGPNATREQVRSALGKQWDMVDNYMGLLTHDNIMWNNIGKDAASWAAHFFSWFYGSTRAMGEAGLQLVRQPARMALGERPQFTPAAGWLFGVLMTTAWLNGVLTYAMTGGDMPKGKDFFYFRTGKKNPDGTDERMVLPGYVPIFQNLLEHPVDTTVNQASNAIRMIKEFANNEDSYHKQLRNPDDPVVTQIWQLADWVGREAMLPISVRTYEDVAKVEGPKAGLISASLGVRHARKEIMRADWQNKLQDFYQRKNPVGPVSPEYFDRRQVARDWMAKLEEGTATEGGLNQAVAAGEMTKQDARKIVNAIRKNTWDEKFKHLDADQALIVYNMADDDGKRMLLPALRRMEHKFNTPSLHQRYREAIVNVPLSPTPQVRNSLVAVP